MKMAKHVPVAGLIPRNYDINLIQRNRFLDRSQPWARIVVQGDAVGTRATDWPVLNVLHRRLLAIAEECLSGF